MTYVTSWHRRRDGTDRQVQVYYIKHEVQACLLLTGTFSQGGDICLYLGTCAVVLDGTVAYNKQIKHGLSALPGRLFGVDGSSRYRQTLMKVS